MTKEFTIIVAVAALAGCNLGVPKPPGSGDLEVRPVGFTEGFTGHSVTLTRGGVERAIDIPLVEGVFTVRGLISDEYTVKVVRQFEEPECTEFGSVMVEVVGGETVNVNVSMTDTTCARSCPAGELVTLDPPVVSGGRYAVESASFAPAGGLEPLAGGRYEITDAAFAATVQP